MNKKLKILVIRFSSLGDIILVTPVLRCLRQQLNAEVDFLTKQDYCNLLITNKYLRNIFTLSNNKNETLLQLKKQKYDFIIDLHNNLRSLYFKWALRVKSYTYSKNIISRFFIINFGVNLLNKHIIDRYFMAVADLGVINDKKGIDYEVSSSINLGFNTNQDYICWCIGGTYENKKLSYSQISDVIKKINIPVLFIGSNYEKNFASKVVKAYASKPIYNFCGKTSVEESAFLMKNSKITLTNDTGMMHIASSFNNPIIIFWGCTKPSLGFASISKNIVKNMISPFSQKPCSNHGRYCKFKRGGCIKEISSQSIFNEISKLIK